MSEWNDNIIAEFHANDGKVGGPFEGAYLLLLTTTGAKSGQPHTSPVRYFVEDGKTVIVASAGGQPSHPAWYHNLLANPQVVVEQATASGIEKWTGTTRDLERPERDALFQKIVEIAPGFGEYQEKTTRIIPVVELLRD